MSKKSIVLTLVSHQGFSRHSDGDVCCPWNTSLFSLITDTYLPLLNMFANLEAEGVPFKISMVFTPTLCSLLDDPVLQERYIAYLEGLIKLGEAEVQRTKADPEVNKVAAAYLDKLIRNKRDYIEVFECNILSKFAYYAKKGNVELLATSGTAAFLPHYADMKEAINAQIETGLISHKYYFHIAPEGFWLPYMGYVPGLEKNIKSYGFTYTILDTHGLLFANPVPQKGIFSPVRTGNSLVLFGRDSETPDDLFGENGYSTNSVYRNQNRDIGFERTTEELSDVLDESKSRIATGFKYWAGQDGLENTTVYDVEKAQSQILKDAESFIAKKTDKLNQASDILSDAPVSLVCTLHTHQLGQTWYEGIDWLEQVIRQVAENENVSLDHCSALIENQFDLEKIEPFVSSSNGTGYGEDFLDNKNGWMLRYVRKATERMIDLGQRFSDDTGLKARSLNLAAKEVLLAQSADWAKMIHDEINAEYAESRFRDSVAGFSTVYDSLGSNSISTEWLTRLEKERLLFPWMNYRVFSPKK
jgi:1,4-alpha-glucan branching enzyme